jgi:S1-C subfamily serine protease
MRLNLLTLAVTLVALTAGPAIQQTLLAQALVKQVESTLQAPGRATGAPAAAAAAPMAGYLGANVDDTAERGKGVLITDVKKDAPSDLGGLKVGDTIVEIDGKPCRDLDDLDAVLAKATVGTRLTMKVERQGKRETKTVILGRRPPEAATADNPAALPAGPTRPATSAPPPLTARPAAPTIGRSADPLAAPGADPATSPPTLRPAADPFKPAADPLKPASDPLAIPGRDPALELPAPPGGEKPAADPFGADPLALPSSSSPPVLGNPAPGSLGRASLGIQVVPLNDDTRLQYDIRSTARQGAVIVSVKPGSPAETAGLTAGSVVVAIDGQLVKTSEDLVSAISAARPGQEVELRVYQGDRITTKQVTLAAAGGRAAPPPPPRPGMTLGSRSGPLTRKFEDMVESLSPDSPPPATAGSSIFDPSRLAELHDDIKAMSEKLDALEKRVKALEAKGGINP